MKHKDISKIEFRNACVIFAVSVIIIFIKNICFAVDIWDTLVVSSIWKNPCYAFLGWYFPKLAPAVIISSFVFLFKKKDWLVWTNVLLDLWIISNIFYYNARQTFIDFDAILTISELGGFLSSLKLLWSWSMFVYPTLTIVLLIFLINFPTQKVKQWGAFFILLFVGILLTCTSNYNYWRYFYYDMRGEYADRHQDNEREHLYGKYCYKMFIPGNVVAKSAKYKIVFLPYLEAFVRQSSITQYFVDMLLYKSASMLNGGDKLDKKDVDQTLVFKVFKEGSCTFNPQNNLIIIVVESFESWALSDNGILAEAFPNLRKFMHNQAEHILYCDKLRTEIRCGSSADGQLMITTGLMPVYSGVTCSLYGSNVYPNYAQYYPHSVLYNPVPDCWNQEVVTYSYGFKQLFQYDHYVLDNLLFDALYKDLADNQSVGCYMLLTVASHIDFSAIKHKTISTSSKGVPKNLYNYVNCLHYTDSCMGELFMRIQEDERLKSSIVVITGDHVIWNRSMLKDVQEYSIQNGLNIPAAENFTPLIIYSPNQSEYIKVDDICYQMDIYPTILHAIGCHDSCWSGLGEDLYSTHTHTMRRVSESEAYEISDQLIRSNYFSKENEK